MSKEYNNYILEHKENVRKAFDFIKTHLPELFEDDAIKRDCEFLCEICHDRSKYEDDEYDAYDEYFYGNNRSYKVVHNFQEAWLAHIHKNAHHWQHWVLINDDPEEGEIILDMDFVYIIEMICDWWSFSWKSGNLFEIFDWYEKHKNYIKLSERTRETVEDILDDIKYKLKKED